MPRRRATTTGQPGSWSATSTRSSAGAREPAAGLSVGWNRASAAWMGGRPADAEREMAGLVTEGRARGLPHLALSAGAILGRVQRSQGRLAAALRTYREGLEHGTAAGG